MRLSPLFLWLSCLSVSAAPFSESTRASFGKWKEAILAVATPKVRGEPTPERRFADVHLEIRQMEQALEQGTDSWPALEQMRDSFQLFHQSPAVREAWEVFLKSGKEESERNKSPLEAQSAALTARLKTLVETSARPEDFDEIIQQLEPAGFAGRNESSPLYRKFESARTFAMAWQEYLSAKASGDQNRLAQSLTQFLGSNTMASQFVPRSKLLHEQSLLKGTVVPAGRVTEILDGVKAPADLAAAIAEINQLIMASRNSGTNEQNTGNIVSILTSLQRLVVESKAGLGVRVELMQGPMAQQMLFGNAEEAITRIRALVLRSLIAGFVGQATTGEIRAAESIEAYLKRALKNALSEGDLDALARLSSFSLGSRAAMADYGSAFLENSLRQATSQSLTSCFAARNFEAAGDPLSAVMAWHAALKSGSIYTPAEYIGKRLEAIQHSKPEIYTQAMERALNVLPLPGQGR